MLIDSRATAGLARPRLKGAVLVRFEKVEELRSGNRETDNSWEKLKIETNDIINVF
jgi:hypothetical protein